QRENALLAGVAQDDALLLDADDFGALDGVADAEDLAVEASGGIAGVVEDAVQREVGEARGLRGELRLRMLGRGRRRGEALGRRLGARGLGEQRRRAGRGGGL